MPEALNCVKGFKSSLWASTAKCKWADSLSRRHNCITANEEETGAISARVALLFRTSRYPLIWLDSVKFKLPHLAHVALHNLSRYPACSDLSAATRPPTHTPSAALSCKSHLWALCLSTFHSCRSLFWCLLEKRKCHCLCEAFRDSPDKVHLNSRIFCSQRIVFLLPSYRGISIFPEFLPT